MSNKAYNKFKLSECVACNHDGSFYPLDVDHIKTRGSGGKDVKENCMTLCRRCHTIKGAKGVKFMAENYSGVRSFLLDNGWYLCKTRDKWVRDEK